MTIDLRDLDSFGDVAAEDDAVLDYFLTTDAVSRIEQDKAFLVLGRKGSGKTAIVRHFSEGNKAGFSKALSLKGYPWGIHALRTDNGASQIEAYVASWRFLIAIELAQLAVKIIRNPSDPDAKSIISFLRENYGADSVSLDSILRPKKLRLSKASFEPSVLGNKLGGIALERSSGDVNFGLEINALTDAILRSVEALINKYNIKEIFLHFDELDQGLSQLDEQRSTMTVGLILAARSVRQRYRELAAIVNPVVYLRTDIWDDLEFSDKNKISQTNVLYLQWSPSALLDLVNVRLQAKLGSLASFESVVTSRLLRGGQTKWNHILARTFFRPRDVISFLNSALPIAKARAGGVVLLDNPDIVDARERYSNYLKKELDDEILPHWQQWEEALQACSANTTITFVRAQFERQYSSRCSDLNSKSADEALRLLFEFSVIGYERRSGYGGSSWAFQYADQAAGWDNAVNRFKVHLGLKEYAKLKEERS